MSKTFNKLVSVASNLSDYTSALDGLRNINEQSDSTLQKMKSKTSEKAAELEKQLNLLIAAANDEAELPELVAGWVKEQKSSIKKLSSSLKVEVSHAVKIDLDRFKCLRVEVGVLLEITKGDSKPVYIRSRFRFNQKESKMEVKGYYSLYASSGTITAEFGNPDSYYTAIRPVNIDTLELTLKEAGALRTNKAERDLIEALSKVSVTKSGSSTIITAGHEHTLNECQRSALHIEKSFTQKVLEAFKEVSKRAKIVGVDKIGASLHFYEVDRYSECDGYDIPYLKILPSGEAIQDEERSYMMGKGWIGDFSLRIEFDTDKVAVKHKGNTAKVIRELAEAVAELEQTVKSSLPRACGNSGYRRW